MKKKTNERLVIAVCTGNICRSPVGEALLRHALDAEAGAVKDLKVISAGVAAMPSWPISKHSEEVLKQVGLSLKGHRSQQLSQELVDGALAIYCMTEAHRMAIESGFERTAGKVFLWREFLKGGGEIADPYGGNLSDYELCRDEIVEALPSLVRHLRKLVEGS